MKKKWFLLIIGLAIILMVLGLTGCEQGSTASGSISNLNISNQQTGIWVTGQGEVSVKPDIAIISLGIEAENDSVASARNRAAAAMNDMMDTLTSNGIADKDIQTQYFNIQQVRTWDPDTQKSVVTGYSVTNTVTVTIRDIDKVGTIIDAVAEAGGDLTRINGINFSVDNPDEFYEEARKEAMIDARNKAEELAKQANANLGDVTFISENQYYAPVAKSATAMAYDEGAGYSTSISPGELDISLSIQVAYAIK